MLPLEHSAILLICIKLPFVIKIFVLFIFEWSLKIGFTVLSHCITHQIKYVNDSYGIANCVRPEQITPPEPLKICRKHFQIKFIP